MRAFYPKLVRDVKNIPTISVEVMEGLLLGAKACEEQQTVKGQFAKALKKKSHESAMIENRKLFRNLQSWRVYCQQVLIRKELATLIGADNFMHPCFQQQH